jgi:hypothetical protein
MKLVAGVPRNGQTPYVVLVEQVEDLEDLRNWALCCRQQWKLFNDRALGRTKAVGRSSLTAKGRRPGCARQSC